MTVDSITPHVGAYVNKQILNEFLASEIEKAATSAKEENVVIRKLRPQFDFDKQGVFIKTKFDIGIPKHNLTIKGSFQGATAVSTNGDSLYLRNAVNSLHITDIDFTKKPLYGRRAIASLLTTLLSKYITNINGHLLKKPTIVDMAWGESYDLDLKKLFISADTEVEATPLTVKRHTKQSSIRIDSTGITVMVELAKEKGTGHQASNSLASRNPSKEDLACKFSEFNHRFNERWHTVFDSIKNSVAITATVSKSEIAAFFNEVLANPVTLKQTLTMPKTNFNQKLEVKNSDINCQEVRTSFSYPSFNGASCNWSCQWWNEPCRQSRNLCRVKRETERIAWQVARETARVAHQVENEAKVAACNVWREATNFAALGRFKGDVSGDASGKIDISNVRFNEDLSTISIKYSGKLQAKLLSDLELQPIDLGHIFLCIGNYNKKTSSNINVTIPDATLSFDLSAAREGNSLNMNARISPIPYTATISNSPLHMLLVDPRFQVQCPIFSKLVGAATVAGMAATFLGILKLSPEQELLLNGNVKGEYRLGEMSTTFKPLKFKISEGPERTSEIFWNNKSIQFTNFIRQGDQAFYK
jgi:hypothetical protein